MFGQLVIAKAKMDEVAKFDDSWINRIGLKISYCRVQYSRAYCEASSSKSDMPSEAATLTVHHDVQECYLW